MSTHKRMDDLADRIYEQLREVIDPCSVGSGNPMNIVEMGLIKAIDINGGAVRIDMCLTSPTCMMLEHFVAEARRFIGRLPGVTEVDVRGDVGLEWTPDRIDDAARSRRRTHLDLLTARLALEGGAIS
ncbi:iron-sulfur cluster assembly protein [Nocardia sp. R6R-6]|uniref:iron-sulfur cluster assembly protein n=1 Tax=Nocardia sp. R6R-6 TaxID=3459303 RepID=UPI00403E100D